MLIMQKKRDQEKELYEGSIKDCMKVNQTLET